MLHSYLSISLQCIYQYSIYYSSALPPSHQTVLILSVLLPWHPSIEHSTTTHVNTLIDWFIYIYLYISIISSIALHFLPPLIRHWVCSSHPHHLVEQLPDNKMSCSMTSKYWALYNNTCYTLIDWYIYQYSIYYSSALPPPSHQNNTERPPSPTIVLLHGAIRRQYNELFPPR